ncbi:MAG: Nucleoside triphosphate pyrophosphohydrolase [Pseudomonadota bacterium]|nr:Nucleoside triphosphate pyrophosphohydrolase [Pseudomonadota bacterium]
MKNIQQLLDIMAALRHPQTGCPWDIKQTFRTIVPYTLEEAYEVADSIERGDMRELKSELGDLLFQVVFYAQMAKERGLFEFADVVDGINDKLVRRHPHVFADARFDTEQAVHDNWEKTKAAERDALADEKKASILEGVARSLPALKRAQKLQKRAARVGFDWPAIAPVLDKLNEEIAELRAAMQSGDQSAQREELGDLLFTCVNLARHLDVDSEEALRQCNHKFEKRFGFIEQQLQQQGRDIQQCHSDELEELWQKAKTWPA